MIPIPPAGILRRVEGVLTAGKVPYIEEVVIHVREGYELVPLPEGSSYLGFIFARGGDAVVEGRVRPLRVARGTRPWTQPNKPLNFIQPRRFTRTVAGRECLAFQQLWQID